MNWTCSDLIGLKNKTSAEWCPVSLEPHVNTDDSRWVFVVWCRMFLKCKTLVVCLVILEGFLLTSTSVIQDEKFLESKYQYFSESERIRAREDARRMFYHGYENYMKHAFPLDELDPIHCTGRGPDRDNP